MAFLSSALEKQMRKLCRIVLKGSILNEATTAYLLPHVDIEKKENQFNFDRVKLGTKQKQMLSWDFAVRPKKKREFKMGLALTLRQILKKIKERSLLITLWYEMRTLVILLRLLETKRQPY